MKVQMTTHKDTFKDLPGNIKYYLGVAEEVELLVTDQYKDYDIRHIREEFKKDIDSGKLIISKIKKRFDKR